MGQVGADHRVEGLVRTRLDAIHIQGSSGPGQFTVVGSDLLDVSLADRARINLAFARIFKSFELDQVIEVELQFLGVRAPHARVA